MSETAAEKATTTLDEFYVFAAEKGFEIPPYAFDDITLRFEFDGDPTLGWVKGYAVDLGSGAGVKYFAKFGDHRSKREFRWESTDREIKSPEEKARVKAKLAEDRAKRAADKAARHAEAAAEAERRWALGFPAAGRDGYLRRKGLGQEADDFGCRTYEGNLLVPARDADGKLWSIQKISSDGEKKFMSGGKKRGCFHMIGDAHANRPEKVFVCEGIATAGSVYLAIGKSHPVACAFDTGNLLPVATELRKKYPEAQVVLCADNDQWNAADNSGIGNPGIHHAKLAAAAVSGVVAVPDFSGVPAPNGGSDYNDLAALSGLGEVSHQLGKAIAGESQRFEDASHEGAGEDAGTDRRRDQSPGRDGEAAGGDAGPLDTMPEALPPVLRFDNRKKEMVPKPPSHQEIANTLAEFYGSKIIKQKRDLFLYVGTHWKWLDLGGHDKIRQQLQRLAGGSLTWPQVQSCYNLFIAHCNPVPEGVDLFSPPALMANFVNGTLIASKTSRGDYELTFAEHRPNLWCVNVLPYEYKDRGYAQNTEFDAMLERVFAGNPDKAEKIFAVQEMFGACLMGAFPRLFMLFGPPKTGKSTLIKLAARLTHKENVCSVDPTEFEGFNMETMAGKLLNYDTDIEMHKPLSEKQIKKIIDRVPVRIRRKQIGDIYAPMPPTHIFGGNGIPKALDGASRAQDRRWTFIEVSTVVEDARDFGMDYADWCFEQGPEGVVGFAIEGIKRVLKARGRFTVPESGRAKMEKWQLQTDPVGMFLHAIEDGEVVDSNSKLNRGPGWKIERAKAWEFFKQWYEAEFNTVTRIGRNHFYDVLRSKNIVDYRTKSTKYLMGIGFEMTDSAKF